MNKSALSALLFLTLIASGCGAPKAPSDLLRAPSQGSTNGTITSVVKSFLPANAHLTVPVHSESGSAIQLQDLDKDGQNEILAFYKTDKTDYEINTLVLKQTGGDWNKLTTITGVGSQLDYVQFADVTADGQTDMLLGFSGGQGLSNELSVYSLNSGVLTEVLKQAYDYLAVGDLTGERKTDIALFQTTFTTDMQPVARLQLFRLSGGKQQSLADQTLDGAVIQAVFAKAAPSTSALFVDMAIGAHSSYTLLLTWENGKFIDILATDDYHHAELADSKDITLAPFTPGPGGKLGENNMAIKDYPLYSSDANGDGIVEVGFLVPPAGTESMAPLATPFITKYYQWDGQSGLKFTEEKFDRWGFNFHIPQSWRGKYTLEIAAESPTPWESISFNYHDHASGEEAELLELRLLTKQDWQAAEAVLKAENRSYQLLYELQNTEDTTAPTVLVAVLPPADAAGKLSGASLTEYNQLKLSLTEVRQLAGTPQQPLQ
ncbi:VCBS repeat-containing protein [Paenibacillus tianjinensis]|uniref:VCBS repeat-containing protein n=1 Tax=Paenibacillus tianjinensis TaxID=2810347 RepID=A0ABX7L872_9BACL|nr:VCBS repeat-containing protein [Paenibacillus tianjinensis]QSF44364.1 VCBS repeat-containing protein [Paenibacillus tianjinensis]